MAAYMSGFRTAHGVSSDFVTVTKSAPKKMPCTPSMVNSRLASGDTMDSRALLQLKLPVCNQGYECRNSAFGG